MEFYIIFTSQYILLGISLNHPNIVKIILISWGVRTRQRAGRQAIDSRPLGQDSASPAYHEPPGLEGVLVRVQILTQ